MIKRKKKGGIGLNGGEREMKSGEHGRGKRKEVGERAIYDFFKFFFVFVRI